jgi:hypothetical protein
MSETTTNAVVVDIELGGASQSLEVPRIDLNTVVSGPRVENNAYIVTNIPKDVDSPLSQYQDPCNT